MKEYRSRNSGRYVFNEDIHNLQDLALSSAELFRDADSNFIISGCAITITENHGIYTIHVASGYVWLNDKIRKVNAFTGTTSNIGSIGIYETQPESPQITYFSGESDYQYNDYASEVRINFDNTDNIACLMAEYVVSEYKFPDLRSVYFNHYCIMNNGTPGNTDYLVAGEIDVTTLKISHTPIADIFVLKAGDYLNDGASLVFTDGDDHTVISGNGLTVGGSIVGEDIQILNDAIVTGSVTADSFIKSGGSSSEFLKADGSVDNTPYAAASALNSYLLLTGGTISGDLAVRNLTVNSDLAISGEGTVTKDFKILRDLTVSGESTFNDIIGADLSLSGSITEATNITLSGNIHASTGTFGSIQTSGTLVVGGTLTTASTASIGGDTTINGELTATKIIKLNGAANQFLMANGDTIDTVFAEASSLNNYLLLTGGTITGNLTCQADITAAAFKVPNESGFLKADGQIDDSTYLQTTGNGAISGNLTANKFLVPNGTANGFLKANGDVDTTTYAPVSSLSSYLPLTGGSLSGALTSSSTIQASGFIVSGGSSSGFLKADGSIDSNVYLTGIASDTIETSMIKNNAITAAKISNGAVGSDQIANGAVGNSELGSGAVTTAKIYDLAVTTAKINDGAVTTVKIADGAIINAKIANDAITNAKIADGTIITSKIADYAITTDKIAGSAITNAKINNLAITADKIADRTITSAKIRYGSITTNELAEGSVTSSKLANGLLDPYFLKTGGVISGSITASSFIVTNGTSSGFLKANGSIDNNTYARIVGGDKLEFGVSGYKTYIQSDDSGCDFTDSNGPYTFDNDVYINDDIKLYTNGTITASKFKIPGGTAAQFLLADGTTLHETSILGCIPDLGIETSLIDDDAITSAKLAQGSVTDRAFGNNTISGTHITVNTLPIDRLAQGITTNIPAGENGILVFEHGILTSIVFSQGRITPDYPY